MNSIPLLLAGSLLAAAPRIDATFPPPRDDRRSDVRVDTEPRERVGLLGYTADGRLLAGAAAGERAAVRLWHARPADPLTGTVARTLDGTEGSIVALAGQGQPAQLVAVTASGVVHRWDPATGKLVETTSLGRLLKAAALRPGADPHLAVASAEGTLLLDHRSGKTLRQLPGPPADAIAFSGDGKLVVTGKGRALRWWNTDDGQLVREASTPGPIAALAMDSKGTLLGIAGRPSTEVWDVASWQKLCTLAGSAGTVSVAFSPNGQKLATSSRTGVHIWTVPLPPLAKAELARIREAVPAGPAVKPKRKRRLLVFWRAEAILHKAGVPAANEAIERLGESTRAFQADFSRDYEVFDPKILRRYDAIVLNSTAHLNIPEEKQRQALLDYVDRGGGVVGIHAAIDMFKRWPEGARVVGATFAGHPWGPSGSWAVKLEEPEHPLLKAFAGKDFRMQDEFYELGEPYSRSDRRVLMKLDIADPPTAGVTPLHRADRDFAVAWVRRHGKGRVFYGMFGHRAEPFMNPAVLQFYLDGIQYALGDLPVEDSPR